MEGLQVIEIVDSNFSLIKELANEAVAVGHSLGRKLLEEWKDGSNTFANPGEKLWGVAANGVYVAFGGLNVDPYANEVTVGRIRHIYVASNARGRGVGRFLMENILAEAKKHFKVVRLSTKNPVAASLYESLGFLKTDGHKVTHVLDVE